METARVRAQLGRILASADFADAARASSFLRFVVERTLAGRSEEIKEFVIAVEVLGRNSSFDSKSDPIVRVEAARLRDRLGHFYLDEGGTDDVLISIPRGGYVPEFSERKMSAPAKRAEVLRLSIVPPENAVLDSFAISPDGRKLAFTASLNARLMLWVRELDSLDARPLSGTENASFPFWSPDSHSIGFFTPSRLKTIPIIGGPSRDIAEVVVGRGGTWNREGIIVFCPRPVGVLHQVPAAGGTPKPVTFLDASRGEVVHGFPQFLPDGRQFLYFAVSYRPAESCIRAGSLDSSVSTVVLSTDTSATYAPVLFGRRATLLYVSHGSLMGQPFDAGSLELRGEPEVIASEVRYRRWGRTSVSVSNDGILLYQAGNHRRDYGAHS